MTRLAERIPTATGIIRHLVVGSSPLMTSTGLFDGLTSYRVEAFTRDDHRHSFFVRAADRDEASEFAWVRIATGMFDTIVRPWQFTDPPIVIDFEPFPRYEQWRQRLIDRHATVKADMATRLRTIADRLDDRDEGWNW